MADPTSFAPETIHQNTMNAIELKRKTEKSTKPIDIPPLITVWFSLLSQASRSSGLSPSDPFRAK
jgi:hypothetical protein